jgi:hyaluronan synthase
MSFFTSNFFLDFLLFFSFFAGFLWFYYYCGLYLFSTPKPRKEYAGKVAAIIPTYNEDSKNLRDTIKCIRECEDIETFVFVDDGSKNNVKQTLTKLLPQSNYIICEKNQGKRHAQYEGIDYLTKKYGEDYFDCFVMLDSDTTFRKDAIYNLIQKMQFRDVGAVTANVLVKNRTDNLLTRGLSAMYWSSSNIWRQAPANYGYMQVTNGQLSVYRAKPLIWFRDKYLGQTFCGNKCAFSDDRWFTQHLQTDYNLRIEYEKSAIAYTYVPNMIQPCWKMMLRWKKGSLRETLLITKHIKRHPMLVLDCWWNHLVSIFQLIVRVSILILTLFHPIVFLYYLAIVTVISIVYGLNMLLENPKEIIWRIYYSFLNELIFGWLIVFAIKDLKNQGWETR